MANLTLRQVCQKKEGFSSKVHSDRAQDHVFAVSRGHNQVVLDNCCGTPFVQKLHSSTITHLQILTYFSLVAGLLPFMWRHICTVFI